MIDHISLRAEDYPLVTSFYKKALSALGYEVVMEFPEAIGLGAGGKPDLWITRTEGPVNPTHLAFRCERAQVDAFHAAALAAGGTDHGPPGVRPEYHKHYYGAFAFDPEGNNVEAVCHDPPDAAAKGAPAKTARKKTAAKRVTASAPAKRPAAKAKAKSKTKAKTNTKKTARPAAKKSAKRGR